MTAQKTQIKSDKSTILLDKEVIDLLKKAKEHPRQTYNEIIKKITSLFIQAREKVSEKQDKIQESQDQKISEYMGQDT